MKGLTREAIDGSKSRYDMRETGYSQQACRLRGPDLPLGFYTGDTIDILEHSRRTQPGKPLEKILLRALKRWA